MNTKIIQRHRFRIKKENHLVKEYVQTDIEGNEYWDVVEKEIIDNIPSITLEKERLPK